MKTTITEIAADTFRINTFIPDFNLGFSQFLVRDEEPLHPDLPRLRHRLPFPVPCRQEMVSAVQQYVPHLWLGESERAKGHVGQPDVKGHRERTQGRRH